MNSLPVITKIDGARRQLDCAIRLFFNGDDSLAIHTLAHAAFKVLYDIYPKRRADGFANQLSDVINQLGWRRFSHVPNFLKHADNDAAHVLSVHSAEEVETTIGLATILHHRIVGRMTHEMRAFDAWMHVLHPEQFQLAPDQDPDFEAIFRESIAIIKNDSWETRLTLGKALMSFYHEHPDIGGFGAPYDHQDDMQEL